MEIAEEKYYRLEELLTTSSATMLEQTNEREQETSRNINKIELLEQKAREHHERAGVLRSELQVMDQKMVEIFQQKKKFIEITSQQMEKEKEIIQREKNVVANAKELELLLAEEAQRKKELLEHQKMEIEMKASLHAVRLLGIASSQKLEEVTSTFAREFERSEQIQQKILIEKKKYDVRRRLLFPILFDLLMMFCSHPLSLFLFLFCFPFSCFPFPLSLSHKTINHTGFAQF